MAWDELSQLSGNQSVGTSWLNSVLNNLNYLKGRTADGVIDFEKPLGLPRYDVLPLNLGDVRAIAVLNSRNTPHYWNGTEWIDMIPPSGE